MKFYLCGKVSKNDWRSEVVNGLRDYNLVDLPWLPRYETKYIAEAYLHHDYVGPFFVGCDHGCYHGPNTHVAGVGMENVCCGDDFGGLIETSPHMFCDATREAVFTMCVNGVKAADLVFAWIDRPDVYGTLFELGVAYAAGKTIAIAWGDELPDLWFAGMSRTIRMAYQPNPVSAFKEAMRIATSNFHNTVDPE